MLTQFVTGDSWLVPNPSANDAEARRTSFLAPLGNQFVSERGTRLHVPTDEPLRSLQVALQGPRLPLLRCI